MERKTAILFLLADSMNPLFVVDRVNRSIKDSDLQKVLLDHFESLNDKGSIKIKQDGKDFFVTIREATVVRVTWTFITTYIF